MRCKRLTLALPDLFQQLLQLAPAEEAQMQAGGSQIQQMDKCIIT